MSKRDEVQNLLDRNAVLAEAVARLTTENRVLTEENLDLRSERRAQEAAWMSAARMTQSVYGGVFYPQHTHEVVNGVSVPVEAKP